MKSMLSYVYASTNCKAKRETCLCYAKLCRNKKCVVRSWFEVNWLVLRYIYIENNLKLIGWYLVCFHMVSFVKHLMLVAAMHTLQRTVFFSVVFFQPLAWDNTGKQLWPTSAIGMLSLTLLLLCFCEISNLFYSANG